VENQQVWIRIFDPLPRLHVNFFQKFAGRDLKQGLFLALIQISTAFDTFCPIFNGIVVPY
jgi:hypothetical protein